MNKPVNIQIVSNGEGNVFVLENGVVVETYYMEFSCPSSFKNWLEDKLVKYQDPYKNDE